METLAESSAKTDCKPAAPTATNPADIKKLFIFFWIFKCELGFDHLTFHLVQKNYISGQRANFSSRASFWQNFFLKIRSFLSTTDCGPGICPRLSRILSQMFQDLGQFQRVDHVLFFQPTLTRNARAKPQETGVLIPVGIGIDDTFHAFAFGIRPMPPVQIKSSRITI